MAQPLIILGGGSVRAAAESAARASFSPWCIDQRGDADLRAAAPVRLCPPDQFPMGMLKLLDEAPPGAPVLLCGPLENHAEFVRAVAFQRDLFGAGVDAIAAVREPTMLPSLREVKGLKFPAVRTHISMLRRAIRFVLGAWGRTRYLHKPRASFGGIGIEWWEAGGHIDRDRYVQQHIRGEPYTAVFHADGWSCFLMGVVEQIVGDAAFGAEPRDAFRVCGYVGPTAFTEQARGALSHLGVQLTQRFDMRGSFSVDMVMDHGGVLWPVEVNPRYSAAAEVIERSEGVQTLTGTGVSSVKGARGWSPMTWAKAQVLAKDYCIAPDLYATLPRDQIADVPQPGRRIARGDVICTALASGRGRDEVMSKLRALAGQVYHALQPGNPAGNVQVST
jgi:predicted ATP-grasp superfamily ATP-dependent carboligase